MSVATAHNDKFDRYAQDAILRMHWVNKKWTGSNKSAPLQVVDRIGTVLWLGVWEAQRTALWWTI